MKAGLRVVAAVALILSLVAIVESCSSHSDKQTAPPAAKELDSPNIAPSGGQYVHTFTHVGTFNYHCSIHPSETATVTVDNGSPAPLAISIMRSGGFNPDSPTVGVGSTVTWTNNELEPPSGTRHTVTSNP
jgi:plastocyanin